VSVQDFPNPELTPISRDALGQVTESIDQNGHATSVVYDAAGNVTESFDGNGKPTYFSYDADNREITTKDA
jgi:YD repeat-containing protein